MDIDDVETIKHLLEAIRTDDDDRRKHAISNIPSLIHSSLNDKNENIDQLLLAIYNLNTTNDNYEYLNLGNKPIIFKHLLRLFTENVQDPEESHVDALAKIVNLVDTPDLLTQLAYAIYKCSVSINDAQKNVKILLESALNEIQEKATANLYPDVLLIIHSINALKQH